MNAKTGLTPALTTVRPAAIEPWREADWQRLWLSLQGRPWTALAVVPASSGAPTNFTMEIATTLARVGMIHLASPIHVADATDLPLGKAVPFLEEVKHCRATGDRVILALAPIAEDPLAESLAQSADGALLCVLFESMAYAQAARTVSRIGKERFIGSTIFHPDQLGHKK